MCSSHFFFFLHGNQVKTLQKKYYRFSQVCSFNYACFSPIGLQYLPANSSSQRCIGAGGQAAGRLTFRRRYTGVCLFAFESVFQRRQRTWQRTGVNVVWLWGHLVLAAWRFLKHVIFCASLKKRPVFKNIYDRRRLKLTLAPWMNRFRVSGSQSASIYCRNAVHRARGWRSLWLSVQDHPDRRQQRGKDLRDPQLQVWGVQWQPAQHYWSGLHRSQHGHRWEESKGLCTDLWLKI